MALPLLRQRHKRKHPPLVRGRVFAAPGESNPGTEG